jgi:hypothetical protein
MQAFHGKARVQSGDCVAYYWPTADLGSKDKLQALTAIGIICDGAPYQFDIGGGFQPFRCDVRWFTAREVPIKPLLGRLEFTPDGRTGDIVSALGCF